MRALPANPAASRDVGVGSAPARSPKFLEGAYSKGLLPHARFCFGLRLGRRRTSQDSKGDPPAAHKRKHRSHYSTNHPYRPEDQQRRMGRDQHPDHLGSTPERQMATPQSRKPAR